MYELARIFQGWGGYQTSLLHALITLSTPQLNWRPTPKQRSLGEVFRHIGLGRITWLSRIPAPGVDEVASRVSRWFTDGDGSRHVVEESVASDQPAVLAEWLELSWKPIQRLLDEWTIDDLFHIQPHRFRGTDYLVTHQWVLWRIMSHDLHHGGQVATMLAMQDINAFELRALGGHLTVPTLAKAEP